MKKNIELVNLEAPLLGWLAAKLKAAPPGMAGADELLDAVTGLAAGSVSSLMLETDADLSALAAAGYVPGADDGGGVYPVASVIGGNFVPVTDTSDGGFSAKDMPEASSLAQVTATDGSSSMDLMGASWPHMDYMSAGGFSTMKSIVADSPAPGAIVSHDMPGMAADAIYGQDATARMQGATGGAYVADEIVCGNLAIYARAHRVTRDGEEISLTPKEFDILYLLAANRGEVFTKEQIYKAVWADDFLPDGSNIMAFIRKLRKKIEPSPDDPQYILTIWGIGYKFNDAV